MKGRVKARGTTLLPRCKAASRPSTSSGQAIHNGGRPIRDYLKDSITVSPAAPCCPARRGAIRRAAPGRVRDATATGSHQPPALWRRLPLLLPLLAEFVREIVSARRTSVNEQFAAEPHQISISTRSSWPATGFTLNPSDSRAVTPMTVGSLPSPKTTVTPATSPP